MSLYADYINERGVFNIIENEDGFAVYTLYKDSVHLDDIYVKPESRLSARGRRIGDAVAEAAKATGLKTMTCCVVLAAKNASESLKAALAYGFRLLRSDERQIYLIKEI